jgi:hypothetical protein
LIHDDAGLRECRNRGIGRLAINVKHKDPWLIQEADFDELTQQSIVLPFTVSYEISENVVKSLTRPATALSLPQI